jgi:hypothetical protein
LVGRHCANRGRRERDRNVARTTHKMSADDKKVRCRLLQQMIDEVLSQAVRE